MKGCLPCVSRLSKASSQVLPHSQVGLGEEGRQHVRGREGKGYTQSGRRGARNVSLRMLFLHAHPSLRDVANFVRGKKKMKRSLLVPEVDSICLLPSLIVFCDCKPAGFQVVEQGAHPTPVKTHDSPFQAPSLLREKGTFHSSLDCVLQKALSSYASLWPPAITGLFATGTRVVKITS